MWQSSVESETCIERGQKRIQVKGGNCCIRISEPSAMYITVSIFCRGKERKDDLKHMSNTLYDMASTFPQSPTYVRCS